MTRFHNTDCSKRHMASPHPPKAQGTLDKILRSLGARKTVEIVPKREPSWEYISYLERRQKELHQQIILWFGVAVLGIAAAVAISTIWTWPQ